MTNRPSFATKNSENSGTDAASFAKQKDSPASGDKDVTRNRDTSKFEAETDRLVYALYGLSEDEITVVEGGRI